MTISILSVLRETWCLWARHLGFFLLLAVFLEFPAIAIGHFDRRGDLTIWNVTKGAAGMVLPIIFQAIGMAASLSLFVDKSAEKSWLVMVRGVQRYAGQIVGVQVLLFGIAILLMIPIGLLFWMINAVFGLNPILVVFGELIFLIFLKYALANPLVVAENFTATSALGASWRMTKNRFGFVFGCYLIVGVLGWAIRYGISHLDAFAFESSRHLFLFRWASFAHNFVDTFWYVLPWVMYLRIKAADGLGLVARL